MAILLILGSVLLAIYACDRTVALLNRVRMDKRRAVAEYPITGNDPVGRILI